MTTAPDGQYAVMRGVQGPAGMVSARLLLDLNLSANHAAEPISFAPDLYYSATDRLQIGLLHTGPMGWQSRPGVGLCLTGSGDGGCPHIYDNVGFDLMYGLDLGRAHLSLHSSVFLSSFDPLTASVAVGFTGKLHLGGSVALFFDPKVAIAVSQRDTQDDALYIPLELEFQLKRATALKLLTGLSGGLSAFGNTYQIPLGVGIVQNLTRHFDLGARFSFDNLLGAEPAGVGRADTRSLAVLLNVRS